MDLQVLADHGVSTEAWKKILENADIPRSTVGLNPDSKDYKLASLRNRIWSRIQEGQKHNFQNFQTIQAVDQIWDTPFRQVTPSFLHSLLDKTEMENSESVLSALKAQGYDLDSVVTESSSIDSKSGKPIKKINVPAFFKITVPLVSAYLTARKAKLVNDRNVDPFITYKPVINTVKNRAKCHVLSNRAQLMNRQYNYVTALDQAIFQMLLYPTGATMFTYEDWHTEKQLRYSETTAAAVVDKATSEPKKKKPKKTKEDAINEEDYEEYVVREGLRFHLPHPSRVIMDRAFSPRTVNTDTGVRYGGFWKVVTYGEILDTEGYYNKDTIAFGNTAFWTEQSTFFQSVYNSCTLNFPTLKADIKDREQAMLTTFYGNSERDKAVVLCEWREKLVPADNGLGDYKHPIWARFVVAGSGQIVFAQPLGYVPITVWKDNGDDKRTEDASLALKLAGFQDHFENLLTQHILAVKQNLTNFTLIDENVMADKTNSFMEKITNLGENLFRKVNIFSFDSKKLVRTQTSMNNAFYSHRFPPLDTSGLVQSMKLILDIAERVLQFSSQEVAQQATHEQTKHEMQIIQGSTTNTIDYTGLPIDQAQAAMGNQIYQAWNNYGEDDFATTIPGDIQLTKDDLKGMGFTFLEDTIAPNDPFPIKIKKSAIEMPLFAVVPPSKDRTSDADSARVLAEFVRDLMSNPITAQAIGPDQAIDLANQIAKMAGLPLNRELRNLTQDQAQGVLQQVLEQVMPMIKQGMIPVLDQVHELNGKVAKIFRALGVPTQETNGNSPNNPNAEAGPGSPPGLVAPAPGQALPEAPVGPVGPIPGVGG